MMLRLAVLCVFSLLAWYPAEAACSGSGLTWTCTSGSSMANIASAYSSGTDGMTITLDAGSYSWTSTLTITSSKGVTLICAAAPPTSSPWGADESTGCNVTASDRVMSGYTDYNTSKGTVNKLYRISGFNFTSVTGDRIMNLICTCTFAKIRVDHNSFSGANTPDKVVYFGGGDSSANIQYLNGVIDHNKLRGTVSYWLLDAFAGEDTSTYPTGQAGGSNNIFIEDNNILFTDRAGDMNCLDWQGTGGVVFRYNTIVNCRTILHGVLHGGGPSNWEVYRNSYTLNNDIPSDACFGCINHQGSGEMLVWNNGLVATEALSGAIRVQHYRSGTNGSNPSTTCDGTQSSPPDGNRSPTGTYRGYPCYRQPGRDFAGTMRPMYAWMNINSSTSAKVDLELASNGGSPDYFSNHLVNNRDYYNAVSANAQSSSSSPFNGTTGMGYGTLANRPTTCTTTSESADAGHGGVGYWATDQGSWNLKAGGAQGVLYQCSSTNTWTTYYTPYQYPHPLVCEQDGGCDEEPPPDPPSNQRFSPALDLRANSVIQDERLAARWQTQ